jgi:hypothetical protein
MIWTRGINEVVTRESESVGKGGGPTVTTTTYTYFASFAMAIAEGPAEAICRIWMDSKLVFDNSTANVGGQVWKYPVAGINFYPGTEAQFPDPEIQSDKGVSATPAHRGLCYVVFNNLPLLDFGNRIPQVSVEVSFNTAAETTTTNVTETGTVLNNARDASRFVLMPQISKIYYSGSEDSGANGGQAGVIDIATNDITNVAETFAPTFLSWPESVKRGFARGFGIDHLYYWPRKKRLYAIGRAPTLPSGSDLFFLRLNPRNANKILKVSSDLSPSPAISGFATGGSLIPGVAPGAGVMAPNGNFLIPCLTSATAYVWAGTVDEGAGSSGVVKLFSQPEPLPIDQDRWVGTVYSGRGAASTSFSGSGAASHFWMLSFDTSDSVGRLFKISIVKEVSFGLGRRQNITFKVKTEEKSLTYTNGSGNSITLEEPTGLVYDEDSKNLIIFGGTDTNSGQTWAVFDTITEAITGVVRVPSGSAQHLFVDCEKTQISQQQGTFEREVIVGQEGANGFTEIKVDSILLASASSDSATSAALIDGSFMPTEVNLGDDLIPGSIERGYYGALFDPGTRTLYTFPSTGSSAIQRINLGRCSPDPVTLETVVDRIMTEGGLVKGTDYTLDAGFASASVDGYRLTRQMTVRSALEPSSFTYLYDVVESDFMLKFRSRSLNSVAATIPEDDLGVVIARGPRSSRGSRNQELLEARVQELEMPERVDVTYLDKDRDHQRGNQHARRQVAPNPTQFSRSNANVEVPIVMSASVAKAAAEQNLFATWESRNQYDWRLSRKHILLDGTDLIKIVRGTVTFTIRIINADIGEGFILPMKGVSDDVELYTTNPLGTFDAIGQSLVPPGSTELFLADIPYLRDTDATLSGGQTGMYATLGSESAAWRGAALQTSLDGTTFVTSGALTQSNPWGYLDTALAALPDSASAPGDHACPIGTWDRVTTVDLFVANGAAEFESRPEVDVLGGQNAILVGDGDEVEVLQFATRTVVDSNTIRLSDLVRGRRGTEERAKAGHIAGTQFVLLDNFTAVTRLHQPSSAVGSPLYVRATAIGQTIGGGTNEEAIFRGTDRKPLSPTKVRVDTATGSARAASTITLTWERRTRLGGEEDFLDGVTEIPVGEVAFPNGDAMRFELVLIHDTDGTEALSKTVTAQTATLTVTERTDAGYANTDGVDIVIYQLSPEIGRGIGREVTAI